MTTMTSVFDIFSLHSLAPFFVWTLVVCALAKAIFGSFFAAELQHRLAMRDAPKRVRVSRLRWELQKGAHWNEQAARGSPHAATVPLNDREREAKQKEIVKLSHKTVIGRAGMYLMSCWACQTFWSAVLVYYVTSGWDDLLQWFLTAMAYSGAAVLLSALTQVLSQGQGQKKSGCGKG